MIEINSSFFTNEKLVIDMKKLEKPKDTEEILKKNFRIFK